MKTSQVVVSDFMPSHIAGSVAKVGLQMHDSVPYGYEPLHRSNRRETTKYRNQAILDPNMMLGKLQK